MLSLSDGIYYAIYIATLILSFFAKSKEINGLIILRWILVIGLINEAIAHIARFNNKNDNFSHFVYIPLEYVLLCFFYIRWTSHSILRKLIRVSIFVYLFAAICATVYYYDFSHYPAVIYNLGCFFSVVWITLIFVNLNIYEKKSITEAPIFWILFGLLIFYAGVFFFNIGYSYFLKTNADAAKTIRTYINVTLNDLLYLFWSYAFCHSWRIKKS